jgi:aminopeptidase N
MQNSLRLIKQFVPNTYQLSISLDRLDRTFSGIVVIRGISQTDNDSIVLNSKDLSIESAVVDGKAAEITFGENETLIITHPDIFKGQHIVVVSFNGKITDTMNGIYPCYYEHDGVKKELLATQFESHFARRVFPCIDEPEAKATFDVTLTTETKVTVLGNMPIKTQTVEDNKLVTTFETTPIMSSYLLAWVVGELHCKTATTKGGVEVNVWATPAQPSNNLDFALDIATRTIEFFDEYFGIAYPLPKSDHVALPDFSSGAMENWGLITYREIALLVDPVSTSIAIKQHVATVITHELSHQWFGNLVTMKWWNDLWLNESFASLMEYVAVDALEPDWNIWLDFASSDSIYALQRDSLDGVQAIQVDINHPDEISTVFDGAIVYAKGSRLLRMLQRYIGDKAFQTGLKEYFKIHAYRNTEASDLWEAFSKSSQKDIPSLMNAWISQPGFPVVHVSKKDNQIVLSQERLASKSSKPSSSLWPIPLNSNCSKVPKLFDSRSVNINDCDCEEPLRLNTSCDVHFITHYDHKLLNQLVNQIKTSKLPIIDRLQLLNEQNILANAGIISSTEIIPLISAYRNETAEPVWGVISMTIHKLKKFVDNDPESESRLRSLSKSIANTQYEKLGWDKKPNEPERDTKLREVIIGLMLYSKDPEVISSAISVFNSTTLNDLDSDIRALVLSAVVKHDENDKLISSLFENYKTTNSSEFQRDICVGLTSATNPKTITFLLNKIKDSSVIRPQDVYLWIVYLSRNKYACELTWRWTRDNWDWIYETFNGDAGYDDFPRYLASSLSTNKQLDEYRKFFTPLRSDPVLTRVIDMGINEITDRVDLIERDGADVRQALRDF